MRDVGSLHEDVVLHERILVNFIVAFSFCAPLSSVVFGGTLVDRVYD